MELLKKSKGVAVDVEKEYGVPNSVRESPLKHSLIFPIPWEESCSDSLISFVNQSLMRASDGMKELDVLSFCVIVIALMNIIHKALLKDGLLMK